MVACWRLVPLVAAPRRVDLQPFIVLGWSSRVAYGDVVGLCTFGLRASDASRVTALHELGQWTQGFHCP